MRVMALGSPVSLDHLCIEECADPGEHGPGEIRVRLHGSSLNFHDLGVARGVMPTAPGRIPLSDGAGLVDSVGTGVTEF